MTAEEYLEQIKKIDELIINKLNDHKRWVDIADGLGGFSVGERVQSSPNLQRGAEAIGRYIDIERKVDELNEQRNAIISTIEQLPPIEYKILYKLYVEYDKDYTIKIIAYQFKRSYEFVKKRKRKALRLLQKILDERAKS